MRYSLNFCFVYGQKFSSLIATTFGLQKRFFISCIFIRASSFAMVFRSFFLEEKNLFCTSNTVYWIFSVNNAEACSDEMLFILFA